MTYQPRAETQRILEEAYYWVDSVPYPVTARWVFYRLLQEGTYDDKSGYKHLLGILSKARKEFYGSWRPWTLADDTRAPILMQREGYYTLKCRGWGFTSEDEWLSKIKSEMNCPLDRWVQQPIYAEVWFEAAAMQGQFLHYANENLPLLAFHGDVSIPQKWEAAERLAERFLRLGKAIRIYYFGDLDPKGLAIPESAWGDIYLWTLMIIEKKTSTAAACHADIVFERIGINKEQVEKLNIPENPERPGTYQWEGLDDDQAASLIGKTSERLDIDAFETIEGDEDDIGKRFREKLE